MTQEVALVTLGAVRRCVMSVRRRRGWRQADLAAAVGRSQQWVSALERGRGDPCIGDVMSALSALGATIAMRPAEAPSGPAEHSGVDG